MSGQVKTAEELKQEYGPQPGSVLDEHATEVQLAQLLLNEYLPPVRCVGKDWRVYEKGVWRRSSIDEFKPDALSVQHHRSRTARKARDVLKHIEYSTQAKEEDFRSFHFQDDNGEIVINCANYVLAISEREIRELAHSEKYYFSRQLAASYVPTSEAPNFEDALQFSLPDPEDIELFRSYSGYILMPDCRHEAALVCYGPTQTGKSTLAAGIESVFGENLVTEFSLSQLSNPENKNLAKLQRAALNLSTELDAIEVGSENFKRLVSGESFDADRKYRDSISLRSSCKLWFNANQLPRFRKGTDAELRRLRFLRFDQKVQAKDETLKAKIKSERDGILLFAIEGLRSLLKAKVIPNGGTGSVQTRTRFQVENDPISSFVDACCHLDADEQVTKDELFRCYKNFCARNGIPIPESDVWFFRKLYDQFHLSDVRRRDGESRVRMITGITTVPAEEA